MLAAEVGYEKDGCIMGRGYSLASDEELLRLYAEHGTVAATARIAGFADKDWVRRRLRRLGVAPGKPGRPRG